VAPRDGSAAYMQADVPEEYRRVGDWVPMWSSRPIFTSACCIQTIGALQALRGSRWKIRLSMLSTGASTR
jgi:hypothetical protein